MTSLGTGTKGTVSNLVSDLILAYPVTITEPKQFDGRNDDVANPWEKASLNSITMQA